MTGNSMASYERKVVEAYPATVPSVFGMTGGFISANDEKITKITKITKMSLQSSSGNLHGH